MMIIGFKKHETLRALCSDLECLWYNNIFHISYTIEKQLSPWN
jgi:hypothetical protein